MSELDEPRADEKERAEAERFARALETRSSAGGEDVLAEALAVARLLDGLRARPVDELSRARLRRELGARAAVAARARRAALATWGALAAALLLALGLVLTRRPAADPALLGSREEAARAAVQRLASARVSSGGAALGSRLASSRFDSILSTLDDARTEKLRWTEASSSSSGSTAEPSPTVSVGGAS
jgi:hypothetical protein